MAASRIKTLRCLISSPLRGFGGLAPLHPLGEIAEEIHPPSVHWFMRRVPQGLTHLLDGDAVARERVVDDQDLDVADPRGTLDRLQRAHWRAIGVGRILVDELL